MFLVEEKLFRTPVMLSCEQPHTGHKRIIIRCMRFLRGNTPWNQLFRQKSTTKRDERTSFYSLHLWILTAPKGCWHQTRGLHEEGARRTKGKGCIDLVLFFSLFSVGKRDKSYPSDSSTFRVSGVENRTIRKRLLAYLIRPSVSRFMSPTKYIIVKHFFFVNLFSIRNK